MKIKIGTIIYDPNETPIALIFDNDQDRKTVAGHIASMQNRDGKRAYLQFPKGTSKTDLDNFLPDSLLEIKTIEK